MNEILVEIFGLLGGGLVALCFVPQMLKTIRTKETKSLSLSMYVIYCMGCVSWIIYGALIESPSVVFWNTVILLFAGVILIQKIRFG